MPARETIQVGIGAAMFVLMSAALAVTVFVHDDANRNLVIGTIIGQFVTVIQFYVGSSSSSQKKDEIIAQSLPPAPVP